MTYTLLANATGVTRDADGASIPADPRNTDWQAYQAWLAAGNVPTPAPIPPAPVLVLTFLQFIALFTPAEQAAIVGSADVQVKLFVMMATGSGGLSLDNAEVIGGVNYLADAGIIAPARAAAVLAGQIP